MPYPVPTQDEVLRFETDGFLVVQGAISSQELETLASMGSEMIGRPDDWANDWDWRRGEPLEKRAFRIVQCGVDHLYPWLRTSPFRLWATRFGAVLMRQDMEFWYEQFLAKPPGTGAPTPWHQDEAYWGRTLDDAGITCWIAFHDVGVENGCMHFARSPHRELLDHRSPPEMASDLLVCPSPLEADVVPCPLKAGSVTFHHSKTPHMATGNSTDSWRLSLTQHFRNPACAALATEDYSWRVRVRQR